MKIRLANKFDLPYYTALVHKIHNLDHNDKFMNIELDDVYLNKLFNSVIHGHGIALIAEHDNKQVGMTMSIISPNVWSPTTLSLHQVLLYIDENYRNTRAGYKLIAEYNELAEKMREENKIKFHTITASEPMFKIDFSRFGYEMIEKTWIQGV
jgi:hypothetical protein